MTCKLAYYYKNYTLYCVSFTPRQSVSVHRLIAHTSFIPSFFIFFTFHCLVFALSLRLLIPFGSVVRAYNTFDRCKIFYTQTDTCVEEWANECETKHVSHCNVGFCRWFRIGFVAFTLVCVQLAAE